MCGGLSSPLNSDPPAGCARSLKPLALGGGRTAGGAPPATASACPAPPPAVPSACVWGVCLRIIRWGLAPQIDQIPRERESIAVRVERLGALPQEL